jgi:nucleotide-binding universal stress UspA family protein
VPTRCRPTGERSGPAIVEAAEGFGADLIVMGSRGLRELGAVMAGSVSHPVIVKTERPVLLLKTRSSLPMSIRTRRVLAAVRSLEDLDVIQPALAGLGQPEEVIVLHVREAPRTFGEAPLWVEPEEEAQEILAAAVGVVSRHDLLKSLARDDADIEADVRRALEEESRRLAALDVRVKNGVAELSGEPDPRLLRLAEVLVRTVPGVLHIRYRRSSGRST